MVTKVRYKYRSLARNLFNAYYQLALSGEPCLHCADWYRTLSQIDREINVHHRVQKRSARSVRDV